MSTKVFQLYLVLTILKTLPSCKTKSRTYEIFCLRLVLLLGYTSQHGIGNYSILVVLPSWKEIFRKVFGQVCEEDSTIVPLATVTEKL